MHYKIFAAIFGSFLFICACLALASNTFFKINTEKPTSDNSKQTPTTPSAPPKLLFLGDLMYDRNIRKQTRVHGSQWPLQPLVPLFQEHDAVVATLEGPITDRPSRSEGSAIGSPANYNFTFPLETAPALASQGDFILNLGNNHILNQGVSGVASTKQALADSKINFFGWTGQELESVERVHVATIQDQTFAFVNYNQFLNDGLANALQDITWAEQQPGVVATIVIPHWGNEYQPVANETVRAWATELVTSGADLIVGSHPHVVQNFDEINGVPVYFSLGNAVFDQYFSPETMSGLAVSVTWNSKTKIWSFEEYPLSIGRDGQTKLSR